MLAAEKSEKPSDENDEKEKTAQSLGAMAVSIVLRRLASVLHRFYSGFASFYIVFTSFCIVSHRLHRFAKGLSEIHEL